MKKVSKSISLILISVFFFGNFAFAQVINRGVVNKPKQSTLKRLALVIGNSDYQNTAILPNPQNDAVDMKAALESLGFEVLYGVNQNAKQMKALIRQFGDKLLESKGVGLFYYAGHGIASGGENYLVPVDADIPAEDELPDATVSLSFLLNKIAVAENSLNIVILDACRNNPFARKWRTVRSTLTEGGLTTVSTAPTGTLIAYATQPGSTASDGTSRNGLYTQELLQQMKRPNMAIEEVFKNVRTEVRKKSKNAQVPWESSSIEGEFYFSVSEDSATVPKPQPQRTERPVIETQPEDVERKAWLDIQNSSNPQAFREFLKAFPSGANLGKAKIRLEQLVWESVKESTDKTKLQEYLNEFPNGANASRAKLKLTKLNITPITPTNQGEINGANKSGSIAAGTPISNRLGMKFAYIPAGSFQMGETQNDSEKPIHTVVISKGFYLGTTEVTQAQWVAVMWNNPSSFKNCDNCPVENVSWEDVQSFIKKLNERGDGKYRLPTEAEWEYAARSGSTANYSFGDGEGSLSTYAWYDANSESRTHEVATRKPNVWGLYDLHGNVWEWVQDWYGDYPNGNVNDPTGAMSGTDRVLRGGSWGSSAVILRSAHRSAYAPSIRDQFLGFRVIRY